MVTHYTMVFCMRSLNAMMPNWQDYSCGSMDGHPHMKIPLELAEMLSGKHAMVVMQNNKTMIALYRMFSLQFMQAKHIHGRYRHGPGYICKSWITLDEHGLATFLDQAMLPMELMSSQQLQFMHFPKSSMIAWGFDRCTHGQRMQSVFWQKKVNVLEVCNKLNKFSMWHNPLTGFIHGDANGSVAVSAGGQSQDLVFASHHHNGRSGMGPADSLRRVQHARRESGTDDQPTAEGDERPFAALHQIGDIGQKWSRQIFAGLWPGAVGH